MEAVACPDQLCGNPHLVTGALHTAFQYVRNFECFGDVLDAEVLVLEREARCPRRHLQVRNLREHVQECLGQPVRKIFIVLIPGHVDERQDRD